MIFFNKWKLRTIPLKNSVYFFFIAVNYIDFAADLWYNKMGFIFFKKNFFAAHLLCRPAYLTKLCQDSCSL